MIKTQSILRLSAVFLASALVFACSDDPAKNSPDKTAKAASPEESAKFTSACDDVSDPAENLEWLKNAIADGKNYELWEYSYYLKGTYNNQTVFVQHSCCPSCNYLPTVYTCDGQRLESAQATDVTNTTVVYQGGACNL